MKNSVVFVRAGLLLGACTNSQPARTPEASASGAGPQAGSGGGAKGPGMMGPGMMGPGMMGPGMMPHGKGAGMGHGMMAGGGMNDCPMQLEGVTVKANDVEGGAQLVFSTTGDVAELRRRVAHMAEMHAHGGQCPMMSMHAAAPAPAPSSGAGP